jgi:hypothetical protein
MYLALYMKFRFASTRLQSRLSAKPDAGRPVLVVWLPRISFMYGLIFFPVADVPGKARLSFRRKEESGVI